MARGQDPEVCYDARAAASYEKTPPLSDWLQDYPKLGEALATCALRFVVNLPEESLYAAPRLCFVLQEAYWFYMDDLYDRAKRDLPKLNQMNFFHVILEATDVLRDIYSNPKERNKLFHEWREHCRSLPIKGAVLFNPDLTKCLMVQPWKGDKWGFPRGKINEGESQRDCAVREVWEETGIDIAPNIDETHFVRSDAAGRGGDVTLFLVQGIPEDVQAVPNTKKEISKIGWIDLRKLPGWEQGENSLRFIFVEPFVSDIKKWVQTQRRLQKVAGRASAAEPADGRKQRVRSRGRRSPSGAVEVEMDFDEAVNFRDHNANHRNPVPPTRVRVAGGDLAEVEARLARRAQHGPGGSDAGGGSHRQPLPFELDMARVMREFDRGWDGRASRG